MCVCVFDMRISICVAYVKKKSAMNFCNETNVFFLWIFYSVKISIVKHEILHVYEILFYPAGLMNKSGKLLRVKYSQSHAM